MHGKTGACGFNKPNSKLGESKFKSAKDLIFIFTRYTSFVITDKKKQLGPYITLYLIIPPYTTLYLYLY